MGGLPLRRRGRAGARRGAPGARELIEAEAADAIGAGRYERSDARVTERNGHRARLLATRAGDVELKIPKLRKGSFMPSLLEPRRAHRPGFARGGHGGLPLRALHEPTPATPRYHRNRRTHRRQPTPRTNPKPHHLMGHCQPDRQGPVGAQLGDTECQIVRPSRLHRRSLPRDPTRSEPPRPNPGLRQPRRGRRGRKPLVWALSRPSAAERPVGTNGPGGLSFVSASM